MGFAISLLLDADVSQAVEAHWQRLADAGLSRSMLDLGYQPHVTLGVFDHLDMTRTTHALDDIFRDASQLAVTLTGITTFGPGSGVVYAALAPSPMLIDLHARVLTAIGGICRPHYQIGRWMPHCTLATNLSDEGLEQSKAQLAEGWPLAGAFAAADFVEFAPVVGIKRWALRAAP